MKKACFVALVSLQLTASAQQKVDIEKYIPGKVIDKVEIIFAPSLIMPQENGFSDYINSITLGRITYRVKPKLGYLAGMGLIHSFGKRFDLNARILYEKKGYKWEHYNSLTPDTVYTTNYDIRSGYLTYSILPTLTRRAT